MSGIMPAAMPINGFISPPAWSPAQLDFLAANPGDRG
jgi:hypothetical protein